MVAVVAAFEPQVAETWLQARLVAATALATAVGSRIYNTMAPRGVVRPYVVYQLQAAVDANALSSRRPYARLLYLVRVIAEGDGLGALGVLAWRIDAALQGPGAAAAGGHVLGCTRREPFQLVEVNPEGVRLNHRGGIYELFVSGQ